MKIRCNLKQHQVKKCHQVKVTVLYPSKLKDGPERECLPLPPHAGIFGVSVPSSCRRLAALQREATLHLVGDHFTDGEGRGGRRRGGVPHVEHPAAHVPDPAVKHKVVHEVSVPVESLSSNSRRTPAEETTRVLRGKTVLLLVPFIIFVKVLRHYST